VAFSSIVEAAKEKYPLFRELIDYSDPRVFWIIPSLIILRSLEDEDEGLAESFLTSVNFSHKYLEYLILKQSYLEEKCHSGGAFSLYNKLENLVISQEPREEPAKVIWIMNKVKEVAVSL
jgi:hypothetical protein